MLTAAHSYGIPDSPLALPALNDISILLPKTVTRQAAANEHFYSSVESAGIIAEKRRHSSGKFSEYLRAAVFSHLGIFFYVAYLKSGDRGTAVRSAAVNHNVFSSCYPWGGPKYDWLI